MAKPVAKPVVSIIMPLYNKEKFVSSALASVLAEKTIPLEVIVVDDGSTDRSVAQVQRIADDRIHLIHSHHQGIAFVLNRAIAQATGDIVMRCDADDRFPPGRIAQQVDWLRQHPEFTAVCGNFSTVDAHNHPVLVMSCGDQATEITSELLEGQTRTHLGTYAIRRDVLKNIGGCRPYFRSGEDIDLQLRIAEVGRVWYQPYVQYFYRIHDNSLTHTLNSTEREFFDSIAREFRHQRKTQGLDVLQRGTPPTPPKNTYVLSANNHIQHLLVGRSWKEHSAGQKLKAILTGIRIVVLNPRPIAYWRNLLALIIKAPQPVPALMPEASLNPVKQTVSTQDSIR